MKDGSKTVTRRHQEGNAAWKAGLARSRFKPGHAGLRKCTAFASSRLRQCRGIAMNGLPVCYRHGGASVRARRRLKKRRKVKHHAWSEKERTSDRG